MRIRASLFSCLFFVACSGVDMSPGTTSHARRDMAPGPGLFSGNKGEFVILRIVDKSEERDSYDLSGECHTGVNAGIGGNGSVAGDKQNAPDPAIECGGSKRR